jgi:hypothetical protein
MSGELQFYGLLADTGLTVTARVYNESGSPVGSDVTCSEVGSTAIYIGDMPSAAAGTYGVRFIASGEAVGSGVIEWDGTQEITGRDIVSDIADVQTAVDGLNDFDPASDTVANVALVDTVTTNTDMRGTDSAITSLSGIATSAEISALNDISAADVNAQVDSALADYDAPTKAEMDAGFAALNDFDPANDTVANVTLVDTVTTNTDMRGTDSAITSLSGVATAASISALNDLSAADVNAQVDAALADYDAPTKAELDAGLAALNDFDPANDVVARVTLVDTTTSNTDMRGTDSANTVAPDNASIAAILADTNELQSNQGDWATATGFATAANIAAQTVDLKGTGDRDLTDVYDNTPTVDLTAVTDAIADLNDFDPATDTVARVTLVDTTTANTDMRGTDSAITSLAGVATSAEIGSLNDLSAAEVNAQVDAALADYDAPTKAELDASQAAIIAEVDANEAKIDSLASAVAALPSAGSITGLQDDLDLLKKYHDNNTVFFAADGTTEVSQSEAFSTVVYDDDGTTVLKRIYFVTDLGGTPVASVLSSATGYTSTAP